MMYEDFAKNIFKILLEDCKIRLDNNSRLIAQYHNQIEQLKLNAQELTQESQLISERISTLKSIIKPSNNDSD
ncbi:hypothetical protein [Nostoc cycadae]|uniref:Uncharacterized protein n=1 Tax=Nostoc cycadae WK-1 TaxID=1861711 RepID=A0A2H6LQX9_9NOSO|nr:hypothetical protein [Nostoc cycadae]GBE95633.1 hypothetical protein NCWK1_5421 [Nostoc cycadae WK-1]